MFRAEHYRPVSLCAARTPAGSEPLELFTAKTLCILHFERLTPGEPLDRLTVAFRSAARKTLE
jgi:hypothetical protein